MDHKARTMFSQHVSIKRPSHTLCTTWSVFPPLISVLTVNLFELVRVVQRPARTHQRCWHYYCLIQKEAKGKQCLALESNCCFMWSGCWRGEFMASPLIWNLILSFFLWTFQSSIKSYKGSYFSHLRITGLFQCMHTRAIYQCTQAWSCLFGHLLWGGQPGP